MAMERESWCFELELTLHQWRMTPATMKPFVTMYEMRTIVLTRATTSASFSFLPAFGPIANAHIRQALCLFRMNPIL
jgi:hypothetical protein